METIKNVLNEIITRIENDEINVKTHEYEKKTAKNVTQKKLNEYFQLFYEYISKEDKLQINVNKLKQYEYNRYYTLVNDLIIFIKTVLFQKIIMYDKREKIYNYTFHYYKKTKYHKIIKNFKLYLDNKNINLKNYISKEILDITKYFFLSVQKRINVLEHLFLKNDFIKLVNKTDLDNFIFKMIFLVSIIVYYLL